MIFKSPLVVLDTETTGLPGQSWARVVEIGAVLLDCDGAEVDSYTSLIRPDVLDERARPALAINGISRSEILSAPPAETVMLDWCDWLQYHEVPYLTAFNLDFDRTMLEAWGFREYSRWANCIMKRARQAGVTGKLAQVAAHYGVAVNGAAHRALNDARVAAGIAVAIKRGAA